MKNFLNALNQFGMEGLGVEDNREISLEEEMAQEIAMEAELDEAYSQMDFAGIVAATSQAEAMLTAMADREAGLESNTGRDATTVYGEFGLEVGMEAVKDVVARKAYSGLASLKALINTCIKWLKSLLGIHTASKKIFAGLKKKATDMRKQLSKGQVNVSDKLKRDMPNYTEALKYYIGLYSGNLNSQKMVKDNFNDADAVKSGLLAWDENKVNAKIDSVNSAITAYDKIKEELKEKYDKTDTTEYEGASCYSFISDVLKAIENNANKYKSDDFQKIIDGNIKSLEKVRTAIDKDKNAKPAPNLGRYFNKRIEKYTKLSGVMKVALKSYVNVADDALTMAKGIYATLV